MNIECPHCSQSIDLGGSGVTDFSCPSCNERIELMVHAKVKSASPQLAPPSSASPRTQSPGVDGHFPPKSGKPPVTGPGKTIAVRYLLGALGIFALLVLLMLFIGVMISGIDDMLHFGSTGEWGRSSLGLLRFAGPLAVIGLGVWGLSALLKKLR